MKCEECENYSNQDRCPAECDPDLVELASLCKELLNGADKCSQSPHYIVQPFLGIVKKHADIINKYDLV